MPEPKCEAPPGRSGAPRNILQGRAAEQSFNPEHINCNVSFQGPCQIGEIADGILLAGAEARLERLLHRFSRLNPGARIDARREAGMLLALIHDLQSGNPADIERAA